jgi:hypothetical protein
LRSVCKWVGTVYYRVLVVAPNDRETPSVLVRFEVVDNESVGTVTWGWRLEITGRRAGVASG